MSCPYIKPDFVNCECVDELTELRVRVADLQKRLNAAKCKAVANMQREMGQYVRIKRLEDALRKINDNYTEDPEWPGSCSFCGEWYGNHKSWCVFGIAQQALEGSCPLISS
jgi:hypothetical protein